VFAESEDDPEVLELVSDATGVEVIDDLLVESPGDSGSYTEMLRHDAGLIADSLAPE
jgi:ABC-type Zn2+ transport system substrate-binding protein/surface adhesin